MSSPSTARKFSLRLRSEITFHELPPAFTCTPTVAAVLVKIRKPPGTRQVACPAAVERIESVAALAPASEPPYTNDPTNPAVEARHPIATDQSASAVTLCPMAVAPPWVLVAARKLSPAHSSRPMAMLAVLIARLPHPLATERPP